MGRRDPGDRAVRWFGPADCSPYRCEAHCLARPHRRGGPRLDVELSIDPFEMVIHGARRETEDDGDFPVALSLGYPLEHLRLARGQPEGLQYPGRNLDELLAQQQRKMSPISDKVNGQATIVGLHDQGRTRS